MLIHWINIKPTVENLKELNKLFDQAKTDTLLRLNGDKIERKLIN